MDDSQKPIDSGEARDDSLQPETQSLSNESQDSTEPTTNQSAERSTDSTVNNVESENSASVSTNVADQTPVEHSPKQSHMGKKSLILAIIITLLVGVGGTSAFFLLTQQDDDKTELTLIDDSLQEEEVFTSVEDQPIVAAIPDYQNSVFDQKSSEEWYSERKKIEKPSFLKSQGEDDETDIRYYEVGTREGKTIIMELLSLLGDEIRFFEVDDAGNATGLLNFNNQYNKNEDYQSQRLNDLGITIDTTTIYDSLTLPIDPFKLDNNFDVYASRWGIQVLGGSDYSTTEEEFLKDAKKIQDTENGVFYSKFRSISYENPVIELEEVAFYYKAPVGIVFSLTYDPFGGREVTDFTFTRGGISDTSGTYAPISRGCGATVGYTYYPKISDTDVTQVGTAKNGTPVYGLVDTDYKILTKYVEEFTTITGNKTNKQELLDNNAIIFYKNTNNEWEVYGSPYYTQFGGCAKPVVYLYPETTTIVDVEVGADVKISDPFYEKDGWQDVVAEPNGYLHYKGKLYDSLFWEGPGYGRYPLVTSGVIVKTDQAIPTIKSQMAQMGFNEKEIADFVTYWEDKMPRKPYTRLSWLQTAEMEALAPLHIAPRPDTILRAFLDYTGLEQPYDIPAQEIKNIERTGFTVTEWGGLTPYRIY